jgi:intein/homing endonuclease
MQKNLIVFDGLERSGKCVSKDTLINTDQGILPISTFKGSVKIDQFQSRRIPIFSINGKTTTSHIYNGGVQSILKVTTSFGYELKGTMVHRILCIDNDRFTFKKLKELQIADLVCIQSNQQLFGNNINLPPLKFETDIVHKVPKRMSKELCIILGFLMNENTLLEKSSFEIFNHSFEILNLLSNNFNKLFNFLPQYCYDKVLRISSCKITSFFESLGVTNACLSKEIPQVILKSPKQYVAAYLAAYFEGDGSVMNNCIEITTTSEKMSIQLQILLLNFGIVCKRKKMWMQITGSKSIKRPYWNIIIAGENIGIFAKEIGFISKEKNNRLKILVDKSPFLKEKSNTFENLRSYLPIHFISKTRLFYDKVKSISKGRDEVLDFSVPKVHCFCGNGFINHNSTQIRLLSKYCSAKRIPHMTLHTSLLAGKDVTKMHTPAKDLAYLAALYEAIIKADEYLKKGWYVFFDRYILSQLVFSNKNMQKLNEAFCNSAYYREPALTFCFLEPVVKDGLTGAEREIYRQRFIEECHKLKGKYILFPTKRTKKQRFSHILEILGMN